MEPVSLRFASAARVLGDVARAQELTLPTYRTPPRQSTLARALRRHSQGTVVSVQLRDRPWTAVLADMVEGLAAANGLTGTEADACRTAAWAQLEQRGLVGSPGAGTGRAPRRRSGDPGADPTGPRPEGDQAAA